MLPAGWAVALGLVALLPLSVVILIIARKPIIEAVLLWEAGASGPVGAAEPKALLPIE